MEIDINYFAVVVAAIVSMFIGALWYGKLFRKQWMELMGFTAESMMSMKMKARTAYILQFVASLVMACVLARVMIISQGYFNYPILHIGLLSAFWMWLGFVLPVTVGAVLWEGRAWKLWFINAGNYLVSLFVIGIILALFN
jgi:ABC-type multidrug transport system permease subunit